MVWGSIWEDDGYLSFYFIPEETGYYRFYSAGNDSPHGGVMDVNYNVIANSDFVAGDINGDGLVNAMDPNLLKRILSGQSK